jgi:hypothetical protein
VPVAVPVQDGLRGGDDGVKRNSLDAGENGQDVRKKQREEEAEAFLEQMERDGRYKQETWS